MSRDASNSKDGLLKYDLVKEVEAFSEHFQNFTEFYSDFQNFTECRVLLETHSYMQESFFSSLIEASPVRLRIYLKKNWFPQTLWDLELFIAKFWSLRVDYEKKKDDSESQLDALKEKRKGIEVNAFSVFMEKCFHTYKDIIEEYEKAHGKITLENFHSFLELCYQKMLDVHIGEDLLSGSLVRDESGKISVVDFRSSESVKLYATLRDIWDIDLSDYSFLESDAISLNLHSKATESQNSISGRDISHVGVGIIVEWASCPILQVEGDSVTYGDQLIDTSVFPPVKFITSPTQSHYKLQSCELEFDTDVKSIQEKEKLLWEIKENTQGLKGVEVNIQSFKQKQIDITQADLSDEKVLDHLFWVYRTNKRITALIEEIDSCGNTEVRQKDLREMILSFISDTIGKFLIVKSDLEARNQKSRERLKVIIENEERGVANYQRILKEKDDNIRSDLRLLDALWFTLLDQSFTDRIINEINHVEWFKWAIELWAGFSICEDINLSEWQFWNSEWQNRRELLVRWFNKAISGDPLEPNCIQSFVSGSRTWVWNKTKFIADLSDKYHIQNPNGTFNIGQARENLKKPLDV